MTDTVPDIKFRMHFHISNHKKSQKRKFISKYEMFQTLGKTTNANIHMEI